MMSTTKQRRPWSARNVIAALAAMMAVLMVAETATAQQIVGQGNRRVDSETIRSYVTGTASGSLEEARRNLLQTGMFSEVRISRSGSQTVVTVRENSGI